MKYIKSYLFLVLTAALALTGCKQDDLQDDVDALANRVAILEEQVKLLNENLETISFVLNSENKTIQSVTQSGNAYTLTLSNGETLTLNIGVQGSAEVPEITIGSDGCWAVRGESTGVPAIGNAGADGQGYPEFRVNEGSWEVRYVTGDGEVSAWEKVGGDANSDMGVVGDQLIASAEVVGNEFVITYYTDYATGETATASVAIVPGLVCAIEDSGLTLSDPDGYLEVAEDSRTEIPVQISGGTPSVTYPAGWRATIEQADSSEGENNYVLAIYSPASGEATGASSRVTADNTSEVTVRVNSGMYWAVDKIKVRIEGGGTEEPTYASVYEKYLAEGITIGSYVLNSESGITVTEVSSDQTVSGNPSGAYFINEGVTLTFSDVTIADNLILISNSIEGGKAKVTTSATFNAAESGTTNFIAQNIEFTNAGILMQVASGRSVDNLILDGCKVTVSSGNNMFNAHNGDSNCVDNVELINNDVAFAAAADWVGGRILNFQGKEFSGDVTVKNNIFYSTNAEYNVNGTVFTTNNQTYSGTVVIEDNSFINYLPTSQQLIRGAMSATTQITIRNCLFWSNYKTTTNKGGNSTNSMINPSSGVPQSATVEDIKFYNDGDGTVTFRIWSSVPNEGGYEQGNFTAESSDPFDTAGGGVMDFTNGIFTPTSAYANCGAQR